MRVLRSGVRCRYPLGNVRRRGTQLLPRSWAGMTRSSRLLPWCGPCVVPRRALCTSDDDASETGVVNDPDRAAFFRQHRVTSQECLVALVGRPNVGKSTLFNRLVGMNKSLITPTAGTTRDLIYESFWWLGRRFRLVDTGGMMGERSEIFAERITDQALAAVDEADLVVMMVDYREPHSPEDAKIARVLRRHRIPTILVANKCDNESPDEDQLNAFRRLGLGPALPLSAVHAHGSTDLLDAINETAALSPEDEAAHRQALEQQKVDAKAERKRASAVRNAARRKRKEERAAQAAAKTRGDGVANDDVGVEPGAEGWVLEQGEDEDALESLEGEPVSLGTTERVSEATADDTVANEGGQDGEWTSLPPADAAVLRAIEEAGSEWAVEEDAKWGDTSSVEPEPVEVKERAWGKPKDGKHVRVAVVGAPNVGKSSIINRVLGEERCLVSSVAGTTHDVVDTLLDWRDGSQVVLLDTAGIERRAQAPGLDRSCVLWSLKAIQRCDVCILVIDAAHGVRRNEQRIAGRIIEQSTGVIVAVNKADLLVDQREETLDGYKENVLRMLKFMSYVPVHFVSAVTGNNVSRLIDKALAMHTDRFEHIPTSHLMQLIRRAIVIRPPPTKGARRLSISYVTQARVRTPTFVFFVNHPDLANFSYKRFLENMIREFCPIFEGIPISLVFKKRSGAAKVYNKYARTRGKRLKRPKK